MGTKHIHAEVIKAWADGEVIQFWSGNKRAWLDVVDNWPTWEKQVNYRVKPKNIVVTRLVCFSDETNSVFHFNVSKEPNVQYTFTPEGKLVSVEMIK